MRYCAILTASSEEIRSGEIKLCLRSIRHQVNRIVLVWRHPSDHARMPEAPSEFSQVDHVVRSPMLGISAARNAGLDAAVERGWLDEEWVVCFPDDDCTYPNQLIRGVDEAFDGVDIVALPYAPSEDSVDRSRFPVEPAPLTPRFVVRSVASVGLFISGSWLRLRRFEPGLGTGTSTGAGEELDLVLRLLAQGAVGKYLPSPVVHHAYHPARPERLAGGVAVLALHVRSLPTLTLPLVRLLAASIWRSARERDARRLRWIRDGLCYRRLSVRNEEESSPPRPQFRDLGVEKFDAGYGLKISDGHPFSLIAAAIASRESEDICLLLAAHIGALNAHGDKRMLDAFEKASGSYADGVSVSLAARLVGRRAKKAATTDLAPELIRRLSEVQGSCVKVAVIGGEPGVAERAGQTLTSALDVEIVFTEHGFHPGWGGVLEQLRYSEPQVVIVGLGMPLEAVWAVEHSESLPRGVIVLTCGGWLRLLAGAETRSPKILQILQLEWLYRLITDPRRTARRYARGVATICGLTTRAGARSLGVIRR